MNVFMINDPFTLWSNLREKYDHKKIVIIPKARYDCMNLKLRDFKRINEYNFKNQLLVKVVQRKITKKCMLEKTFSTIHALNVLLQ